MITIQRYTPIFASLWDELIDSSVNGTFILRRSYMDYHKSIFEDYSYLIFDKGKVQAVFVAGHPHEAPRETLYAHPGLTYGGLVANTILKFHQVEEIFNLLINEIRAAGFINLAIKLVPRTFCRIYSETTKFFLIKNGFQLARQELNSVILSEQPFTIGSRRLNNQKKFIKAEGKVQYSEQWENYWNILHQNLQSKHQVAPVHSIGEIKSLQNQNPDNISLLAAEVNGALLAGVVIFSDLNKGFIHTQYISSSEEGKAIGAIDAIMLALVNEYRTKCSRISFGISTVQGQVNPGLLVQKEEYGSTGDIFEVYQRSLVE